MSSRSLTARPGDAFRRPEAEFDYPTELVERRGLVSPPLSDAERRAALEKPETAITYIGAILRLFADEFATRAQRRLGAQSPIRIDEIDTIDALCALYHGGKVDQFVERYVARVLRNEPPFVPTGRGDAMGEWVAGQLRAIRRLVFLPGKESD